MLCCSQNWCTEVFGWAWLPECEVNFTIMFLGKMRLYWASALWKLSFLLSFQSTNACLKKLKRFISNLILLGILCKQLVRWHVHCTWVIWMMMLQDVQCHLRQIQPTSTATKTGGCASGVYYLYDWRFVFVSVVQQVRSLWCLLLVFSLFRHQVFLLFNFQCLQFRSTLSSL